MAKIGVVGDYDSIYGFGALGLDTFPETDEAEAVRLIQRLSLNDYAVIYVTENLAAAIPEEIARFREQITPAIILIPGVKGNTGAGVAGVKQSVEQAVGSDILFGDMDL